VSARSTIGLVGLVGAIALAPRFARAEISAPPSPAADREEYLSRHVPAPWRALELSLGTGYTQGFGMLESGVGMPRVVTPGMAFDLGLAWRPNARWSFGFAAEFQELTAQRSNAARGATAGPVATLHFSPFRTSDPWVSLGAGYRMLWEAPAVPAPNVVSHALSLAKVQAGIDFFVTDGVVLAPVVGADVDVFLWQSVSGSATIADPRASTFVFAGAQGRFEITGDLRPDTRTTSAHR
jgi:hypothetical protein